MAASSEPSVGPAFDAVVLALRGAGCVFAEEEATLLLEEAKDQATLRGMLTRRVAGEPLEQVLGWAEFCGLRLAVAPGVFVPRRRTEALVGAALDLLMPEPARPVVVDLCCGTGAIGAAIRAERPGVELHAADVDPVAVGCARRNLPGAHVHQGDLYDALPAGLRRRVDLVVVNAPYVPTARIATMPPEARDHEHRVALDGGRDGLDVHRRLAGALAGWLAPAGRLVVETSEDQAAHTASAFARAGFGTEVRSLPDVTLVVVGGDSSRISTYDEALAE